MTPNKSLELSYRMQELMNQDILKFLLPLFPSDVLSEATANKNGQRDRIYNTENTLLTMIITAFQEDKSLQNSVNIFKEIFQHNAEKVKNEAILLKEKEKQKDSMAPKKPGRRKLYQVKIPKSKLRKEISTNTASFCDARSRLDLNIVDKIFKSTTDTSDLIGDFRWYGKATYMTDGTYFQMQDSPLIGEKYRSQRSRNKKLQGYPKGLLQGIVQQGSGYVTAYKIGGRADTELKLCMDLLGEVPENSLLLADALYDTYAFYALLIDKNIDIIVPDKKDRIYKSIKQLSDGEEIIEISKPSKRSPWIPKDMELPEKIKLRRIAYNNPNESGKQYALFTTISDISIDKAEIIHKYLTRWDIEISIREMKTLFDMNIARGKSEEMVFKEFGVALIAFNLARKIIAKSSEKISFPPKTDILQKFYETNKNVYVDKKGRKYARWSPGRPAATVK